MGKTARILAAALSLAMLAGCGRKPVSAEGPAQIAYVPLDDRPDNVERVVYLAESLDYDLLLPEPDLYATRLDGQPLNATGLQCGDRAALYEWVLAQEAAGCDRYILSLDQLLSGGLVSSRHTEGVNPVALSDGTSLSEIELLDSLLSALAQDEANQVWLLDSVMRLAPTVGYAGLGLEEYGQLREFGMLPRLTLTGEGLTIGGILGSYWQNADGSAISPQSPEFEAAAGSYLAARERKLRLGGETQSVLSQSAYANFHLLLGIDDSSAEESIQKNEIAYLRQGLRAGDAILSGVDDLAFKAVAKLYLAECGWAGAKANVRYIGGLEDQAACAYDYQPLEHIVEEHLAFFGLEPAEKLRDADLQILVLTAPADPSRTGDYGWALMDAINQNRADNVPTILIDAANDAYGTVLHDVLTEQTALGGLLAYAGFLDMAIVTGTALSHGVARYAWLTHSPAPAENHAANTAFVKALSDSVLKDFCYRNTLRNDLYAYVRDGLGGSPDNFYNPVIDQTPVLAALEAGMAENTVAVLENFQRSAIITSLSPYADAPCGTLSLSGFRFPWSRVFEIGMDIQVEAAGDIP